MSTKRFRQKIWCDAAAMRIDKSLMALRSDPAAQRRTKKALQIASAKWHSLPQIQALAIDLARYAAGQPIADLAGLYRLMEEGEAARNLTLCWADHFLSVMQDHLFAQIPFSHSYSAGFSTMQIAASGNAVLSLVCYEEKSNILPPQNAHFADREQHEIVLAGRGRAQLYHKADVAHDSVRIDRQTIELLPGHQIRLPSRQYGREITGVKGRLLMLQLQRLPNDPRPACDYRLADGALIHQACARKNESQCEMAMAVLGAMGRKDAVPAMLALSKTGASQLRWEAMRHALALETGSGFERLSEVAADSVDPLAPHASKVRGQLLDAYPQLRGQEKNRCPA